MSKATATDDAGVEYLVEQNTGHITTVEHQPGKRNAQVKIAAEGLKLPVTGWADTHDATLWAAVQGAYQNGLRVDYRVEIHRSREADQQVPMAEVGQTDRFRRLTRLARTAGTAPAAQNGGDVTGTPAAAPDTPPPTPAPTSAQQRPGPRVAEGRPWEATNSDGGLNLGSYAVLAAVGMTELAHELLLGRGAGVPTMDEVRRLAHTLLRVADTVQANVRADGHTDRQDSSHARARGAVRTALDAYPCPWDGDKDAKLAWVEQVTAWATDLLVVAVELASERP